MLKSATGLMVILGVDSHHILWKCHVHGDAILQMGLRLL